MSETLRPYDVTIGGHTTRLRLNDTDATAYGSLAVPVADGDGTEDAETVQPKLSAPPAKGRTPANKARTTTTDK